MKDEKTTRKRKRQRCGARKFIQKLEFQFFNSSKTADLNWLKNEIDSNADGWVHMNVLLPKNDHKEKEFNPKLLLKLANESKFIELNEDATSVRLKTSSNKTDESKIFVDKLPKGADSNWIRDAFSRFGHIMKVDCPKPKYKNDKPKIKSIPKNKGFCFVQFTDPTSARKVLNDFGNNDKKKNITGNVRVIDESEETSIEPPNKKIRLEPTLPNQKSKRKCRKRSKTRKFRLRKNVEHHRQTIKGLAIYSFDEWSLLRSDYLTKQKKNFSVLKRNLKVLKINANEQKSSSKKRRGQEKIEDKAALALNASLKEHVVE